MDANRIPPITEPMGVHWQQPPLERIAIDETHALMEARDFERLLEYSTTSPSGVYAGKMWRARLYEGAYPTGPWVLRWFGIVEGRSDLCSNNQRRILIA